METEETLSQDITHGTSRIPVLPLRDVVVYPHMVVPLFVGRDRSIKALDLAMQSDKQIMLVAQRSAEVDEPSEEDLYRVGTLATVLQLLKLPDGTIKVLVEGNQRASILELMEDDGHFAAEVQAEETEDTVDEREIDVLRRSLVSLFEQYVKLNRKIPPELLTSLSGIDDASRLADTVAAHIAVKLDEKQKILEIDGIGERLEYIMGLMEAEIDVLQIEKRIRGRVKQQMEKSQREYYLNEQMKAIQKELGEMEDAPNELEDLAKRIEEAGMPKEALDKARTELNKLRLMSPMSAEATVVRNYLDWLLDVPWKKRTRVRRDLGRAEEILEEDHYGLAEVKERIVEYLAVQQRVRKLKGPILCLVGPPGVGKTSLGQSIARATGRKFVRMSLGGVRDEAEIRGHRRTYIGSMPGRVLQSMAKVEKRNPLFMLDEIDKMSMDFRGDPSSALLEVLDPEQNHTFGDHYLEVDFDLSEVMFIATANSMNIPPPLLDRMEVIRLPGYTEDEKINIAMKYLVPKQIAAAGLKDGEIVISNTAIRDIVRYYTREAGVRNLEREIAKICRKVVKGLVLDEKGAKDAGATDAGATDAGATDAGATDAGEADAGEADKKSAAHISARSLGKYLGVRRFHYGLAEENDEIGQVTGLAWTEVGGELLSIEASVVSGKGKMMHTGQLGDVMQESIHAAMTVVRSRAESLGIDPEFHSKNDFHVHVPEGATPKDGPSAGIGMCTALVSALTRIPAHADVAMTGEITLRGRVLPIGGLKEKLLAAHRGGIRRVIIPDDNRKDLKEIPKNIQSKLEIIPVKWIDEVFEVALATVPKARDKTGEPEASPEKPERSGGEDRPVQPH